jgi:DNA-binding response OmpR family regulator
MTTQYKIYIVEDDNKIAQIMKSNLEKWDYVCLTAADFKGIEKEFIDFNPHLVLLDIILPSYDGFYWCEKIRRLSKLPIVFISSKNTNMDIVMAINMGGDDFIVKPFSISVLVAKVNALFRRSYSYLNSETNIIEHDGIILDLRCSSLSYNNKSMELSKNEVKILYLLFKNSGSIVSRKQIQQYLWDSENFIDDNTLTVNINRIRKKLELFGLKDVIETKKGTGYIIV